ncbi:MAG: YicC family protein [Proteobacteria bacterium]|nr:YicC family protein [Pseudomonadota bacterium]
MPLASMTGFAHAEGTDAGLAWAWELRSVNGRGLDLRMRLPPGWDAIEPALREAAGRALKRGNVTANLTVKREAAAAMVIDPSALDRMVEAAIALHRRIPGSDAPRAEALLALPGVMRAATAEEEERPLDAVRAGFDRALAQLLAARGAEGERLGVLLSGQLDAIAALCAQARAEAAEQPALHRARMMEALADLLRSTPALPEERIAQEVALLATRSDVREELDRLDSHVQAARDLLTEGASVGRRLDFLVQEFNREANTLCSKSASAPLTATGLKLKAAIEQLREQVANIE